MGFAGVPKKNNGHSFNYFQKVAVNWATFGGGASDGIGPDLIIAFPTAGVIFNTEGSSTNTVEYSFNGNTIAGELVPGTNRATLTFLNRSVGPIWFRVKSGSTGPITVSVEAWGSP